MPGTATNTATNTPINTPTITLTPTAADLTIAKSVQPSTDRHWRRRNLHPHRLQPGWHICLPGHGAGHPATGRNPAELGGNQRVLLRRRGTGQRHGLHGRDIPGNSSATITSIVLVNAPCVNLSPFINTAVVNPNLTIFESNFNNNTASASLNVLGCPVASVTSTVTLTNTVTRTPTVSTTPTITSTPLPDFTISKTGPATVAQGGTVTYVITVSNSGSFASGVVVQDNLPPQVTFVSASGGNGFNCDQAAGVVGCTGGILPPGGSATITIFGVVSGCATPLVNTAIVNPGNVIAESSFANNTATVVTTETGCPVATATLIGSATPALHGDRHPDAQRREPVDLQDLDPDFRRRWPAGDLHNHHLQ